MTLPLRLPSDGHYPSILAVPVTRYCSSIRFPRA